MSKINSNKILSSISWSFAEKLLTDLVNTVITVVLARILLPEDYGLVGLVQIFINISLVFVNTGLSSALIQNKDADEQEISTVFYVNLILGIIIYLILFFVSPIIADYRSNEILCPLFRVLAIKIPISSVYSMQHAYIKKKLDFKKYFYSSLAGTIIGGIVGIYMAYKGYGAWSLVASTLIDQTMDSIILFFATKWLPKINISFSKSRKTIDYGLKVLTKEFIGRASSQIRPLIIGVRFNSEDLAYSGKGQKLPQMVSEITESTLTRVMFPVLSLVQDDKNETKSIVKSTMKMSFFVLSPFMFGLIAIANRFIPLLLTDKWIDCIPYLQICSIEYLFAILISSDLRAIEAAGNGNLLIKLQTISVSINIVSLLIAVLCFDNPIYLFVLPFAGTVINSIVTVCYSNKIINYSYFEHIKDIMPTIIASIIMAIVVSFIGYIKANDFIVVTIQVLFGVIFYIFASLLTKNDSAILVKNYILSRFNKQ